MAKSKVDIKEKSKKQKKTKKPIKSPKTVISSTAAAATATPNVKSIPKLSENAISKKNIPPKEPEESKLAIKQIEVNKVIQEKMMILSLNKLSYLEYLELKEELYRLTSLRNVIDQQVLDATL